MFKNNIILDANFIALSTAYSSRSLFASWELRAFAFLSCVWRAVWPFSLHSQRGLTPFLRLVY